MVSFLHQLNTALSCLFVCLVYPGAWAGFIKASNTGQQQRLHNSHFLKILKWKKLVWDPGIPRWPDWVLGALCT